MASDRENLHEKGLELPESSKAGNTAEGLLTEAKRVKLKNPEWYVAAFVFVLFLFAGGVYILLGLVVSLGVGFILRWLNNSEVHQIKLEAPSLDELEENPVFDFLPWNKFYNPFKYDMFKDDD